MRVFPILCYNRKEGRKEGRTEGRKNFNRIIKDINALGSFIRFCMADLVVSFFLFFLSVCMCVCVRGYRYRH